MTLVALVTGITGQDGSYLAELLLDKGYIVWGIHRRSSDSNTHRIDHLCKDPDLILKYGDMTDGSNMFSIIQEIKQKYENLERLEIYNLAAMSHVKVSFDIPEYSIEANGVGVLKMLEAVRNSGFQDKIRFYQASTSELYGLVQEVPQNEKTPFYPRSPYGVSKLYGFWITKNYRESYGMFACNGILFNHESPRRGPTFVTRKITLALNAILRGKTDRLVLGNLDAKRDWGHAKDYVEGMWLLLNNNIADDYVLSTNEFHSVREFVVKAFGLRGLLIEWKGEGLNEIGYDINTGKEMIFVSEEYYRPAEVDELLGDSTKARKELWWRPRHTFDDLVKEMVDADCPM